MEAILGISNEEFNKFLSDNKEKIDRITLKIHH